jgi:protein involved in temperature-dependent protein secretion
MEEERDWTALFGEALDAMPARVKALATWIVPGSLGQSVRAEAKLAELWQVAYEAGVEDDQIAELIELALEVHDDGKGDVAGALASAGIRNKGAV